MPSGSEPAAAKMSGNKKRTLIPSGRQIKNRLNKPQVNLDERKGIEALINPSIILLTSKNKY